MESLLLVDVVSIEGVLALPASKLDLVVRHSVVQLTIEYHLVLKMDLFSIFLIKYKAEKKSNQWQIHGEPYLVCPIL